MKKYFFPLAVIALLALTVAAYFPVFSCGFTNFDDQVLVYENPVIMSLAPRHVLTMFAQAHYGLYHPLVLVSYAVEYRLFGLDPVAFHADNLLLHLANTLLVLLLFMKFSRNRWSALLVAGLFALHPLHVESVAWIAERKDVLYTVFFLLSLAAYLRFRGSGHDRWYAVALVTFMCSLLSKPMAVTLPVILLLIDYLQARRIDRHCLLEKLPFFALSVLTAAATVIEHYAVRGTAKSSLLSGLTANFASACYQTLFYPIKAVFPVRLSVLYPALMPAGGPPPLIVALSVPVLALVVAVVWYLGQRRRWVAFGALWYAVTILPVINLIPSGLGIPADRYTYVPLLGLFFIAAEMVATVRQQAIAALCGAGLLIACAAATHERTKIWENSITLYTSVIENYPAESIAYNNRGIAYAADKNYDAALADYAKAVELSPYYSDACINSANIYAERGNDDKALELYNYGIRVKNDSPYAYYCRGKFHRKCGRNAEALADFDRCINIRSSVYPYYPKAYSNRGALLFALGNYNAALADFSRAIAIDVRFGEGWLNRGNVHARLNRFPEALKDLTVAIHLLPKNKEAYVACGNVLGCLCRYDEAVKNYTAALAIDPGYPAALCGRAAAYIFMNKYNEARNDVRAVRKAGGTVSPDLMKMLDGSARSPF